MSNWYKIAKQDKKPYKIYLITPGGSREIGEVDAHSTKQARMLFLKDDTSDYALYLEMGYTITAKLDQEEYNRRESVKEYEKQKEEDFIQNAWWNQ